MKEISVQELKEMKDRGDDFQLIDVREDFEYQMSNLEGENIPLGGILIETDKISHDKPVVIYVPQRQTQRGSIVPIGATRFYQPG
jgi:rhodanese-related sulfurtransferase